ncbi:MAG TPA: hypothetical protein VMZ28_17155 [Kofleriaceae bacterium]|nr:hypothetical protein [Kofleriaceae bacterium]
MLLLLAGIVVSVIALSGCVSDGSAAGPAGGGGEGGGGGGEGGGGGGGAADDVPTTAFRLTDLDLRDPHAFTAILGCQDVTDAEGLSVNAELEKLVREDNSGPDADAPDGLLDLSALALFRPLDPSAGDADLEMMGGADCTAPMDSTSCTPGAATAIALGARNQLDGTCDAVKAGTTGDYAPAIAVPAAPCFATAAGDLDLETGHLGTLALADTTIAATYDGDPADDLTRGVMRGFIAEAQAAAIVLDTPLGERTLASFLPGAEGNCADHDARDTGPDGETGWYLYLEFVAETVAYDE